MKEKIKESDIAKHLIKWLRGYHWEVYQEVMIPHFSYIADIIAVQNNIVWIIETKTSMCLKVIAQANNWRSFANYISVATPSARDNNELLEEILKWKGIGHIKINYDDVYESISPKLFRKANTKRILNNLKEEHKTFAEAGNNSHSYYSPFKATCRNILKEVERNTGILLNDLIKNIEHHYHTPASAKTSILEWTKRGIVKGVIVKMIDNRYRFYLDD